jgi:uncharacterized protein (DUF4415 family)
MKKLSESFRHEKQHELKGRHMRSRTKKRDPELEALVRLRDEDIDTSDIPEVTDWSKAAVGKFYRPIKEPVSLRLDVDVIAWMKSGGPGYQTRINSLLRAAMTRTWCASILPGGETMPSTIETVTSRSAGCRLRFPGLEKHGELKTCSHVAELIAERGSVFASAR